MKFFLRIIILLAMTVLFITLGYYLVNIYIGKEMRESQLKNFQKIKKEYYKSRFRAKVKYISDDGCFVLENLIEEETNNDLPSIFVFNNDLEINDVIYKKSNSFSLYKLAFNENVEVKYKFCIEKDNE